jgi:acetyl-CoA carboxylase biotin carboxyl carrier protein
VAVEQVSAEQDERSIDTFREVRIQAQELIQHLRGSVHRLTIRAGDCVVEVDCGVAANGSSLVQVGGTVEGGSWAAATEESAPEAEDSSTHRVGAPLVGTFYRAPSPGAEPFVAVDDVVEAGQQLGIIEAMKLMNPINTDVRARVAAIHVEDGQIVEYDQTLFDLVPLDEVS